MAPQAHGGKGEDGTVSRNSMCMLLVSLVAMLLSGAVAGRKQNDNPFHTEFRIMEVDGIGKEEGVTRRDPSDVIKVGSTYFVWYTRTTEASGGYYDASIWYATSNDGKHWTERGKGVDQGDSDDWDAESVFTPNIMIAEGRYYLFYTAIAEPWTPRFQTAIGIAMSDSPEGPWKKLRHNPVLETGPGEWEDNTGGWREAKPGAAFDSHVVDDACLIVRDGKYWLYYKGRQKGLSPGQTKMGVAIADCPEGPYRKSELNPVINSGHEVLVASWRDGVVALVGRTGPQKNTIQYASDGLHFSVKAHIKNPPWAPGAYRPDVFADTDHGSGFRWGICLGGGKWPYLRRFECDLVPPE